MSTLLNTESTYLSLQPFKSVEQLNENTIAIREMYNDQLTLSTKKVLDVLHRYSCKFPGVSYRSKNKIAEELGVSRKTVTRACKQLEDLGIIKQYEMKRHNGDKRRAADAIVFVTVKPLENNNVPTECPDIEALNKAKKPLNNTIDTKNQIFNKNKKSIVDNVDNYENDTDIVKADVKRGLRDKIPAYLYDLLAPYFNLDDLYQAYGALIRGKANIDRSIQFETYEGLFSDAVKSVIVAYKRGIVRNLFAVLYTAARDTSAQIYRKENYTKSNPVADYIKGLF